MNILLIDNSSSCLDFALRCMFRGHQVRWVCGETKDKTRSKVGDGLGIKYQEWRPHMKWADIIFLSDNVKWLKELDSFHRRGFPIIGPTWEAAQLELNRRVGQESFKRGGINTMPSTVFTDYKKAIEFVESKMKRYVSKPDGDADKALSYVSKSPQDMVSMLERWEMNNPKQRSFILQEFVGGVECAVGGWFSYKSGFSEYFLENLEHKKLMNDDTGPGTGEMGTCIKYVKRSKLARETLEKVENQLARLKYTGFVDVAVIVDENGEPRPLEYTVRPGWPLFQIQQAVHPEPVEWMLDLIDGVHSFKPLTDTATGVVVAIPDFPYSHLTKKETSGYPIYGLWPSNPYFPHLHPAELMRGISPVEQEGKLVRKETWISAGDYLVICSGIGDTVRESVKEAYNAVDSLEIPASPIYRTDIGKRAIKDLPKLHEYGYFTEWEY